MKANESGRAFEECGIANEKSFCGAGKPCENLPDRRPSMVTSYRNPESTGTKYSLFVRDESLLAHCHDRSLELIAIQSSENVN